MLIKHMKPVRNLLSAGILLLGLTPVLSAYGEEGQYRSKVRIDPAGAGAQAEGLSVEELEREINSIADPYAKSSAGRHLARHFVENGEYDKAIDYYQTALSASGLSDVANREMLRELAQVYLLSENYAAAAGALERALRIKLVADVGDYLLLAQAYYRLGQLSQVVAALDPIREKGLTLTIAQQRQALALYYQAGAYPQCEHLLRQLLNAEPDNPDNWHHLASVFVQQGKRKEALDQLALAWEKSVPFQEQDIMLLADLQAVSGNPHGAAVTLDTALRDERVAVNGLNYRKLFQFWLAARENDKASAALVQAARLTGDIELYLYLAQLQMEQSAWKPMQQTMLAACKNQLQPKYVGRANVLLGVSQLKLGDEVSARRSFINATLIGGAGAQAGQWLKFMAVEPATAWEMKGIVGICHGPGDRQAAASEIVQKDAEQSVGGAVGPQEESTQAKAVIETKTVPPLRFFYQQYDKPFEQLAADAKSLAMAMGISLVKGGGSIDGSLQIIAQGEGQDGELQLGFPVRGSPRAGGKYKLRVTTSFKCAYIVHETDAGSLAGLWSKFLQDVEAAGHALTDERRVVMLTGGGGSTRIELQIGIE